ncbi:MAG: ras family-domain-containing protein [Benjaminiella poitrasii]|nr:MAG: ras family-domain-containing protein [Benjaminiella poitrasii]
MILPEILNKAPRPHYHVDYLFFFLSLYFHVYITITMPPYLDMNFKVLVRKKIVLVGDGGCGKTCLLNVYTRGYFPLVYEPTVYENYVQDVIINEQLRVELTLWDTAGQEEFNRLRALSYNDAHVVMVCYSIDNKDSLDNISYRWVDELREQCPRANVVLVALKCDLRNTDSRQKVVLYEEVNRYHMQSLDKHN